MKKVLLCLCVFSSLMYLSCSIENEVALQESSPNSDIASKSLGSTDFAKAKQLFIDMIATQDYSTCKASVINFNTKLRNQNISFASKKEWMDWIVVNISNTNFLSVTDFENSYDTMVTKTASMIAANAELYTLMGDATRSQVAEIMEPVHIYSPDPQPNHVTCDGCYAACDMAMDYAWFDRIDAECAATLSYMYGGDIDEQMANILQQYWEDCYIAEYDLNMCLAGCA